jgi:hypothetical protein
MNKKLTCTRLRSHSTFCYHTVVQYCNLLLSIHQNSDSNRTWKKVRKFFSLKVTFFFSCFSEKAIKGMECKRKSMLKREYFMLFFWTFLWQNIELLSVLVFFMNHESWRIKLVKFAVICFFYLSFEAVIRTLIIIY